MTDIRADAYLAAARVYAREWFSEHGHPGAEQLMEREAQALAADSPWLRAMVDAALDVKPVGWVTLPSDGCPSCGAGVNSTRVHGGPATYTCADSGNPLVLVPGDPPRWEEAEGFSHRRARYRPRWVP